MIGGAGGPTPTPQWNVVTNPNAPVAAAWVQPKASTEPVPPVHVCPPPPPTFGYPDEMSVGKQLLEGVVKAYKDAGRTFPDPNDKEAYWHFARYGYDSKSMPAQDAITKRIKELRAQLGLPS